MNSLPLLLKNLATITGAGRGKQMDIPTINFDPSLAKGLDHGVYSAWVTVNERKYMGALHFGPRLVFKDSESFEIHVLDADFKELPPSADLEIIKKIRDVEDFPDAEALKARIQTDIEKTRAILIRQ